MSRLADDEKLELWGKHGRTLCDSVADSLKKKSSSGYKHVIFVRKRGVYSAHVHDIETGKQVHLGYFYTPYAAAVSAALCMVKGKQDERDADLISGCLTTRRRSRQPRKRI